MKISNQLEDRKKLIAKIYQSGKVLTMKNPVYKKRIMNYLNQKMIEDIGKGDITTDNIINNKLSVTAIIKSKERGIIAGLEEVKFFYKKHNLKIMCNFNDGDKIKKDKVILTLKGNAQTLLKTERTALNFLQMMSGIATNTQKYVKTISRYSSQIAATRKCSSDEYLEKKAAFIGKGLTHRIGLSKTIMIKDNHLKIIEIEDHNNYIKKSIERAYNANIKNRNSGIIIEVKNIKEALVAAETFRPLKNIIPVIMLDNMSFYDEKKVIPLIKDVALIEISGNVDINSIVKHAKTGADIISTSKLNREAKALDLSQKIILTN
jgi:nicotinate-nucleotide pyrophosphorylase (carboxylating)